ncbi:MAG: DUF6084 family protein [Vulcanimicrobiaceae bacterium]
MSTLAFEVLGASVDPYAASPQVALRMRVTAEPGLSVAALVLRAQVRIEPQKRRYDGGESERLRELFDTPDRYAQTLRPLLWTHVAQTVGTFEGATEFELAIPCSYDFEVAANKYVAALAAGEIPLVLLFSGTIFLRGEQGFFAQLVPWSCEASYRLPARLWREAVDAFFPNSAWIRVSRETFDELVRWKGAGAFPSWDAALGKLCDEAKLER